MVSSHFRRAFAAAVLLVLGWNSSPASAEIVFSESASGDLGTPQSPTSLGSAGLGLNTVTGTLFNTGGILDPDAFSFTVDAGFQLNSLSFTSLDGPGRHFFAFNDGPLSTNNGGGNLISTLIGSGNINTNILDGSLNDRGGSGLNGSPLGAGTYFVWFQELNLANNHNYSIAFTTTAVPEPSALLLMTSCAIGLVMRRRRNQTKASGRLRPVLVQRELE